MTLGLRRILAILHTWTQTLALHPHLHCIVTGGGLSPGGRRWVSARPCFLFPVPVLRRLFRGKLLAGLKALHARGALRLPAGCGLDDSLRFSAFLSDLYRKDWVVYVKPPFAGPRRSSATSAATPIASPSPTSVSSVSRATTCCCATRTAPVRTTGRRCGCPLEFIRRFLLHVLPDRFVRIRYLLAHRHRRRLLALCRDHLGVAALPPPAHPGADPWQERLLRLTGFDVLLCPTCKAGRLQPVAALPARPGQIPRAPP